VPAYFEIQKVAYFQGQSTLSNSKYNFSKRSCFLEIGFVTPEHRDDQLKINLDWKKNRCLTSCSLGGNV
jgi:hypothetical protein